MTKPTHVKPSATATSETVAVPTATFAVDNPTATVPAPTPPPTPAQPAPTATPVPTSPPVVQPGRLLYAQLRPDTVSTGATLNASVQTSGDVKRVEMYLGSGIPSAVSPTAVDLSPASPGTWTGTITAPSTPGAYHFTVGIFDSAGQRRVIDNDGWNVTVSGVGNGGGQSQPGGAQALPDTIPLAPAFTWGNPVAATFTAEGKTISGSDVASDSRPDVPASDVVTFYTTRLPRAGWAVDPSTEPAAGATSFTLVATSGSQVCVVQYGGSSIVIYYGTL